MPVKANASSSRAISPPCSTATDVEIVDAAPPAGLELIDGSLRASFERIEQGSSVKHVYVLKAVQGSLPHYFEPAKVVYKAETASSEQVIAHICCSSCFENSYFLFQSKAVQA
jgi:hypothetical protein